MNFLKNSVYLYSTLHMYIYFSNSFFKKIELEEADRIIEINKLFSLKNILSNKNINNISEKDSLDIDILTEKYQKENMLNIIKIYIITTWQDYYYNISYYMLELIGKAFLFSHINLHLCDISGYPLFFTSLFMFRFKETGIKMFITFSNGFKFK